jgi:hypothetical protein
VTRRIGPAPVRAGERPSDQGSLGGWYVEPGISLEGGQLVLRAGDPDDSGRNVEAGPPDLLARFVRLQDAQDSAIHEFAARWGLLGLCEAHHLPARHVSSCHPADSESIDAWRRWSFGAGLLWESGYKLARGSGLDNASRNALARFHVETGGRELQVRPELFKSTVDLDELHVQWGSKRRPEATDSRNVALEVGRWLGLGPVTLNFQWGRMDPQPTLTLVATSLFSTIALSIAQTMPEGRLPLRPCEGCHEWFAPKRKNERFCAQCQADGVPARLRQRKRRSSVR